MAQTDILNSAYQRATRYVDGLRRRRVYPDDGAIGALDQFDEPLPVSASDPLASLDLLDRVGSPATVASSGPRYFGYVVGGAQLPTIAANWLASAWDQNAATSNLSPVNLAIEQVTARWILELLDLPRTAHCSFLTGTTAAHIAALTTARNSLLERVGWDVRARGLRDAPAVTLIVGEEVHPTVTRALSVVGFGSEELVRVPVDRQGRMQPDAIPKTDALTIACAQLGNVNTGNCDPIREIRKRLPEAWLHVDGAFGLWARCSDRRHLTEGAELADSWATDGHKWLNVPYDSGFAVVRNPDAMRRALAMRAEYVAADVAHPMDFTLEMSRRARAIDVWMALRTLGSRGVAAGVERCCQLARRFADRLTEHGLEILNEVALNQVLVGLPSEEHAHRVASEIQREGTCWCGSTHWQDRSALRISVCNFATGEGDVDQSADAIARAIRMTAA